jgi:hypothetical protein
MTNQEIISLLDFYGHLRNPFGERRGITNRDKLQFSDSVVKDALESYQTFHQATMSPIMAAFFPERTSATIKINGEADAVTRKLLQTARCACPDYAAAYTDELQGSGNWRGCHNIGLFHCATVKFTTAIPSFLAPVFDEVWANVVEAYAELGLKFERDDNATNPNIDVSFVTPDGGWIGLAIVGQNEQCNSEIWARFDKNYRPANIVSEWTTLIKHELGHNCGLSHSSGGVMNPYIVAGLPVSWKTDVSYNLLKARFGGEPITITPKERKMVLAWQYSENDFKVIREIDTTQVKDWWNDESK